MRIAIMLGILLALSDARTPLYPAIPGVDAADICAHALAINTIADPRYGNSHANSISSAYLLTVKDRTKYDAVAFEYQTYGGAEHVQFFYVGPWIVPFKGDARDALRRVMTLNKMKSVPDKLKPVANGARLRRILCHGRVG